MNQAPFYSLLPRTWRERPHYHLLRGPYEVWHKAEALLGKTAAEKPLNHAEVRKAAEPLFGRTLRHSEVDALLAMAV